LIPNDLSSFIHQAYFSGYSFLVVIRIAFTPYHIKHPVCRSSRTILLWDVKSEHHKRLKDVDKELKHFFEAVGPLADKTLALLIQLPPSLHIFEGLERLRDLVPGLDNRFRYAVEVRHSSWFQDLAYNFFSNNELCLVWSQLAELQTPPILTTDFLYLRFIGDRRIQERSMKENQPLIARAENQTVVRLSLFG
jgi:hypothetical protein